MSFTFDLGRYEDARDNADAIAERLGDGSMPCSPTPSGSPAQSPWPTLTVAFPFADTVGPCFYFVPRLDHFTFVTACRSLCLRFGVVVSFHDARLDSCWLAGP